jgi:hypothetical protein
MKTNVTLNEEDFLQQFPNLDKFAENETALPEWYELNGGQPIPVGKPLNLADLQMKE